MCGFVILQGLDCLCKLIGLQGVLGHFRMFGLDFSFILPVVLCFEFLFEFERHSMQSVTDAVVNLILNLLSDTLWMFHLQ